MLLARLITFFRDMKTFHIFLLEILAVFIGITASLFVDDWRQRQQDKEILDHLLEETHYNALQDRTTVRMILQISNVALEDALLLAFGDVTEISDTELVDRFNRASWASWEVRTIDLQPGYRRLINTSLSIPFDHTMAELDYHFRQIMAFAQDFKLMAEQTAVLRQKLQRAAGLPEDSRGGFMVSVTGESQTQFDTLMNIVNSSDGWRASINDAAAIRAALPRPEVQTLLREIIGLRIRANLNVIQLGNTNDEVIASIRRYDPDVTLPVGVIGLDGDATPFGWENSLPMTRDREDPNIWRLRVDLTDGEVKFRADDNWSTNWGTPGLAENPTPGGFEFSGDASAVFPRGIGEFAGLNIPVEAGTYDVTFNSQSFDYYFEKITTD